MNKLLLVFLTVTFTSLVACKKDNNGTHQVTVRLTDNPFNAEEVNVDIHSVQLKHADDNNPDSSSDEGWVTIDTKDSIYNLLDLQNDVNVLLAQGPFNYDHLQEIRFILGPDNSIKIGGVLFPLTVPSGSSSGFKIKIDRDLHDGNNDFMIDFDAALSIHETGNGKYMLRPVLRLK